MSLTIQAFASQRTVLEDEILPAIVVVANGKIVDVVRGRIDEKIIDVKRVRVINVHSLLNLYNLIY